jgi:YD repeat-containing protein
MVSGTGNIDELRLYPKTAQMTSYTYAPLVGMTSSCDMDNKITYYSYDALGRLMFIKDQDGNIIKTMQYQYINQALAY